MNNLISNFSIDGILHNASQEEVYQKCASKQVLLALNGFNNTIFSYGQTGAGKTYTMTGENKPQSDLNFVLFKLEQRLMEI